MSSTLIAQDVAWNVCTIGSFIGDAPDLHKYKVVSHIKIDENLPIGDSLGMWKMGDGFLLIRSSVGLGEIADVKYLIQDSDQTIKSLNVLKVNFNQKEMKIAIADDLHNSDEPVSRNNPSQKDATDIINKDGLIARHLTKLSKYGVGTPIINFKKTLPADEFGMWEIGRGYLTIKYDKNDGQIKDIKYIIIDSNRKDYISLNLKDVDLNDKKMTMIMPEPDK
jgi:hypothetical protein